MSYLRLYIKPLLLLGGGTIQGKLYSSHLEDILTSVTSLDSQTISGTNGLKNRNFQVTWYVY